MPKKCIYCGNNPVPHFAYWYIESLNVFFTPVRAVFLYNPIAKIVSKFVERLHIPLFLTLVCKVVGIISYQHDIKVCKVPRAKVLWEEAEKRGIEFTELKLFGVPFDTYLASKSLTKDPLLRIKDKRLKIVFSGLPRPEGYDNSALDTLDDKAAFKAKLSKTQLPVPEGGSAWSLGQALRIFRQIQKPVIVKPRVGSRGRHSTTHLYTEDDLKKAFRIAKQLCFWVMVEEHLAGPVYRATVINFELAGVLRGDSPKVTGDGVSTIRELVEKKNSTPHPGVKEVVLDEKSELYLLRQNLSTSSVPQKLQVVTLTEKIGVNYGGSSSEDFEVCHPDTKDLFVAAARVVGDPVVGFDYIIPDITKSYKQQKTGFIEANSLPFINLHHDPLFGKPRNVAAKVWDMVGF